MSGETSGLLEETAIENTSNFIVPIATANNVEDFLQDETCRIRVHATTVEQHEVQLELDIDGFVMLLRRLRNIESRVAFLRLPRFDSSTLLENKHALLKKHMRVADLSADEFKNTKNLFGFNISYLEDHLLFLCVHPADVDSCRIHYSSKQSAIQETQKMLKIMRESFVQSIKDLSPGDMSRPSVQKNSLTNLTKMHVLPQDKYFILGLLDNAIAYANEQVTTSNIAAYISRMGQKDPDPVNLNNLVPVQDVLTMSVHSACTISASQPGTHLFWARDGIQSLVHVRGSMYPVWTFPDVVNYQSNLDNRRLDINRDLRNTAVREGAELNFIQLYAVTPHLHADNRYKHPISGTILACDLFKQRQTTAMRSRAHTYLAHYEELQNKMCPVSARLEVVLLFANHIPPTINAHHLLSESNILSLLQTFPVLVPFKESVIDLPWTFLRCMSSVVSHLTSTLRTLFQENVALGGFDATWKSYQYELALEYFFHGRPLTLSDCRLASILGVNPSQRDTMTYNRGFLGLLPHGSASDGKSPPPLSNWTSSDVEQRRLTRVFVFSTQLDQSPQIIGEQFLLLVIKDLLKRDEGLPIGAMRRPSNSPPGKLAGVLEIDALVAKMLDANAKYRYPSTIGNAFDLLERKRLDKEAVLRDGLRGLKYFPAVKSTDGSKNYHFHCLEGKYVELVDRTQGSMEAASIGLQEIVLDNLDSKDAVSRRNLLPYREEGLPWMLEVCKRIPMNRLTRDQKVNLLCYLSCLGIMMTDVFVDYKAVLQYHDHLAIPVGELQKLNVLSRVFIKRISGTRLFKLSPDIPTRITAAPKNTPTGKKFVPQVEVQPQQEESDAQLCDDDEPCAVSRSPVRFMAAKKSNKDWSGLELSFISMDTRLNHTTAYQQYVRQAESIPMTLRTFNAFKSKRNRMLSA